MTFKYRWLCPLLPLGWFWDHMYTGWRLTWVTLNMRTRALVWFIWYKRPILHQRCTWKICIDNKSWQCYWLTGIKDETLLFTKMYITKSIMAKQNYMIYASFIPITRIQWNVLCSIYVWTWKCISCDFQSKWMNENYLH